MRGVGRARRRWFCARFFAFFAAIALASGIDYGVPIEIKYWDTGRSPLSHMVDVTNGFGLKVLAEHNFLNDNNIAFSPYGLMGIMVALYEGVEGDSSYQIQRAMQLPWNRNIMRIGFRDVHRTLKTYFIPEEGFLAGLALNNENVTFNDNYKQVLRFYGFDFEGEQNATSAPDTANTTSSSVPSTTESPSDVISTTVTTTLSIENSSTTTTMTGESTTNPSVTEVTQEASTTISSTTAANEEMTAITVESTPQNNIIESTTASTEASTEPNTTNVLTSTETFSTTVTTTLNSDIEFFTDLTPSTAMPISLDASTTAIAETATLPAESTTMTQETEATTVVESSTGITASTENIILSTVPTLIASELTTSTADTTMTMSENTESSDTSTSTTEIAPNNAESVSNSLTMTNESSLETLQRRKKSLVDFIFTNPPYIDDYVLYRSFDIGPELSDTGYGGDEFLANGLKNIQVTYMNYDTVLEHAYLPHLEASALRLPLDSDRYYLLVLLPNRKRAGELERLLTRMARESDLSDVYAALRPRRVRALVPSFIVKGHVTLTTDLQRLGIQDVFEPRQSDFTPMTCQFGVYVRSIEQAVSVAIRKYQPDDTKKNRYATNRRRVVFSATYPFLYFVMDSTIHVSLMAGKMVDPLNTRIL